MNKRLYNPNKDGIKIKTINYSMLILIFIICAGVFVSAFQLKSKYKHIINCMEGYAICTKAVNDFRDSSDFLTNQVRMFLVNLDDTYVTNYLNEYTVSKNREKAIEVLNKYNSQNEVQINMHLAYEESQRLSQTEMYAIALAFNALNKEKLPSQIAEIKLLPVDNNLSAQEKISKAEALLFDVNYQNAKNQINRFTSSVLDSVLNNHLDSQNKNSSRFFTLLMIQISTIVAMFIAGLVLFIAINILILRPIDYDIKSIIREKKMHVIGSYEMRLIAKSYNALREKEEIRASILKHKAEHDPLTGLINREAFSQIKDILCDTAEPIAYLIIDIDFFKSVNDKYGHPIGDAVLKKIAGILSEQFRNTDYVARIGGDEFAVIMTKFGDSPEIVIQRKIETINKLLQNVGDGLPEVSLSVGVAISSMGYNAALENQADKALYHVKKGGRCNCSFYTLQRA
ncbi:MAG: GGDEF domain-containing protein [Treponema sp.]|nr:GGDEF domain-containing protein [Treponema sp.]